MRALRRGLAAIGIVCALLVLLLAAGYLTLRASLPPLDGRLPETGLGAPVTVERDALGVVTVTAASRADLAFGTGFAHGQDRFFQMDLSRRLAAGELSELVGPAALAQDERTRMFRFREVARRALLDATPDQRALLDAYTRGVNAGLASLASRPWEYWLLRARPAPWRPEDSFLVVLAMWWQLQSGDFERERVRREVDARLGGPVCAGGWKCALGFLYPARTEWDAPNVADEAALRVEDARDAVMPAVPGAEILDLGGGGVSAGVEAKKKGRGWVFSPGTFSEPRRGESKKDLFIISPLRGSEKVPGENTQPRPFFFASTPADTADYAEREDLADIGSNGWAVAGRLTATGAALVASDMHLPLGVPPTWYRMRLRVRGGEMPGGDGQAAGLDLNGLTLPGAPALVAGSNGHVAWAFTNSDGKWVDVRPMTCLAVNDTAMRTPDGDIPLTMHIERIHVRDRADVLLPVRSTAAGVLLNVDPAAHRCWVGRWLAQSPSATNMNLLAIERATSARQVLALAPSLGIPEQNIVVGDSAGHIGWAIAGRVPVREGAESERRTTAADGRRSTSGQALPQAASRDAAPRGVTVRWLTGDAAPHLYDPPIGRIWTANARPIDDPTALAAIGGEDASVGAQYDLGARARQIRDALLRLDAPATPRDMLRIQLDDRALFLARWRELMLRLLDGEAVAGRPRRAEMRRLVAGWDARADVDSVGYRLVRVWHDRTASAAWGMILRALGIEGSGPNGRDAPGEPASDALPAPPQQFERPLWALVTQQPRHLLAPHYPDWRAFLLAQIDAAAADLSARCGTLAQCRWGAAHPVHIRHPLSRAVPALAPLIDLPELELPGDHDMPRVQDGAFGASERFAVSPGHEDRGYLELPGGQSDHPLSPYYRAGFRAWARGTPLPLLPGPAQHRLVLRPAQFARGALH